MNAGLLAALNDLLQEEHSPELASKVLALNNLLMQEVVAEEEHKREGLGWGLPTGGRH